MIDGISISSKYPLDKTYVVDLDDHREGRKHKYNVYELHGLRILEYHQHEKGILFEVYGSLHKFWNLATTGNENNHTQFTYTKSSEAVILLCGMVGVPKDQLKLHGYEYGFNLHTSFDPRKTIKTNFIAHRQKLKTSRTQDHIDDGYELHYKSTNYKIKIYDKGKHQDVDSNILRIEHNIFRTRKHTDVTHLSNLMCVDTWRFFKNQLEDTVRSQLIIIDNPHNNTALSDSDYWIDLRAKKGRKAQERAFKKLPYSAIKNEILELINSTFEKLICPEYTPRSFDAIMQNVSRIHTYYRCKWDIKEEIGKVDQPKIESKKVRTCLVTGIDISNQSERSKFVSKKTVLNLEESEFNNLMLAYLPIKSYFLSKEDRAYRIAHNIRNKVSNPKQKYRRLQEAGQSALQLSQ